MLFPDRRNYNSSVMVSTADFHAEFVKYNKKYCKPWQFVRIVVLFNKKLKAKMMSKGGLIDLPYIGKFGFNYVTPEDDYAVFGTPRIDDGRKAEYWLSQDDLHYHEISNVAFFTDQPRLQPVWELPTSWNGSKKAIAKCFLLKIARDIQRNAIAKFKSGDYFYDRYKVKIWRNRVMSQ